jgi:nicotinate-nucleotide adenylyltransferase
LKKIGIFGGTFSPPHIGHISAAKGFISAVSLDELIIMPDFLPPHKTFDGEASTDERIEMCRLAFGNIPGVTVSDFEIKRGGKSYTAVTLEELSSPDKELYFLCGTDMFLTLSSWYKPEIIFKNAIICYVRRETDSDNSILIKKASEDYIAKYNARIIPIPSDINEISSSKIRKLIKSGDNLEQYLTSEVAKYIFDKGIYK